MSLIQAADLDTSAPRYLADGIVPEIGVGIWHAPSYTGKSLVVDTELGLAVANGTPFFGRACAQGSVVLCLGEGLYDAGVRKQARLARQERDDATAVAMVRARDGDEAADAFAASLPPYTDENLYLITEPFALPIARGGDASPSMRKAISAITAQVEAPQLVIIDALADFAGGLSLSNDSSANRIMAGMKMMSRELDTLVLAVAHNTAAGDRMLGAQRLYNAADFVIGGVPDDVSAPGADKTVTIQCEKSKYGPEFEPIGYRIEPCEWDQPALDDDGQVIPGQYDTVGSATVRMLEATSSGKNPDRKPAAVLPLLREVIRPRKRSGLRPRSGLHAVPVAAMATAAPAIRQEQPATAQLSPAARQALITGILSVPCPECFALGGGQGCNVTFAGSGIRPLRLDPVLAAHDNRILDAAGEGRISLDDALAAFGGGS